MSDDKPGPDFDTLLDYAKRVAIVVFLVVISWKIATVTLTAALGDFRFSDLLALLLAIFAVGLSVRLYIEGSKTSQKFHDDIFSFTKETSELLGRIEAGFGERLRHLDEGYTGIREKVDNLQMNPSQAKERLNEEEEELKRKEEELKRTIDERDALINSVAERANLEDKEKKSLFHELRTKEQELIFAREGFEAVKDELEALRIELATLKDGSQVASGVFGVESRESRHRTRELFLGFLQHVVSPRIMRNSPASEIVERFRAFVSPMSDTDKKHLISAHHITSDLRLTKRGFETLYILSANIVTAKVLKNDHP